MNGFVGRAALATLALALFAACAQEGTPTLTLWHSYRGAEQDALLEVIEAFEATEPGVAVDVVPVPYDVYANKITNGVPRGNGPDLFLFAQERTGAWADAEIIAPLDGLVDGDALRGLPERMVDAFRYEEGSTGCRSRPRRWRSTTAPTCSRRWARSRLARRTRW